MNPMELAATKPLMAYLIALRVWQQAQGIAPGVTDNPVLGRWELTDGGGLVEFTDQDFVWYRAADSTDAIRGTYDISPGILTGRGFMAQVGVGDSAAAGYSLVLREMTATYGDQRRVGERPSLWSVIATRDGLEVYNQRNAARMTATRVPQPATVPQP